MDIPINIEDITYKQTDKAGMDTPFFDRTKAARSFNAKMQLAIEVFDSKEPRPEIWHYQDGYWHPGGAQLISYYLDEVAENLSDSENINDVLRRIRGKLRLKSVEFDITNPTLIGCRGGITLDLRTRTARKAAPADLISLPLPIKYNPSARCPKFIKFLEDITATDDDRLGVIDFMASLLIAEPMDFFVAAPGQGSNGRSVLKNFIRAFVGSDSCRSIPLKDLSNRFTTGFLTRCRTNFCNETEINTIILEFIKRGSEKMPVEQKFKGMVNMLLYLKYFFDTNTMPAILDTSYGAERRIVRFDFPYRFVDNPNPDEPMEKERDPDILSQITTEEELSGVLNMVLERAPEVIRQRMIHHREGGLQEYGLQSRSGDVFIELFLEATGNYNDRVHIDTIKTAYQEYCITTNSSLLSFKALKTLTEDKLKRYLEVNLKVGKENKRGYKAVKFNEELFKGVMDILKKARAEGVSVFQALFMAYPDELQNTTLTTKHYHDTTTKTTISSIYSSVVVKYREEKEKRNEEGKGEGQGEGFLSENLLLKNTTFTTSLPKAPLDNDFDGSDLVVNGSSVVVEFLQDGGKASLDRLIAEFPEACIFDPPCPVMLAEGGQKITFDELEVWKRRTWPTVEEETEDFLSWYTTVKAQTQAAVAVKEVGYDHEAASV